MDWVSFHTHTTFSYGDGFGTVEEHVKRVADLGMPAVALTEHGNPNSHVALEKSCREYGIKPIYGVEAYFGGVGERKSQRKNHITLIAQDEEGYRNLNKIITQSYLDAYYWPTVSPTNLKKHAKGIVALSGCSDSLISCTLLGGKNNGDKRLEYDNIDLVKTRKKIQWFLDVFEDRFYLEVQRFPGLPRTCILNPTFTRIGMEMGIKLIGTADVHYPFPHQNKMQTLLHAARRGSTIEATDAAWEYSILLTYPQSISKLRRDLIRTGIPPSETDKAISNTVDLAATCNVELPKARPLRFPRKDPNMSSWALLKGEVIAGMKRRVKERPELKGQMSKKYGPRLNMELKVIREKDYCDYFLVTGDLVRRAKAENIAVGPARGSAAASLVAYMLGITEIDPLHDAFNKMIFERFIDLNRTDPPDIDIDFDDERRNEVAVMAREIYGDENVANVGNHIKYRGKKALQDVARAYGLGQKVFDAIGERCSIRTETDERVDDSILDVVESYASDPTVGSLVDRFGNAIQQAIQLEGNQHSMGIHAGGFVIASDPIPNVCAIFTKDKAGGESAQVIPYDKRDAEYLNMLKMDFLGLSTMGMIALCLEWSKMSLSELYLLFYQEWDQKDNPNSNYQMIMDGFLNDDLVGIFQFEGGTTRQLCRKVRPETFDHLAAINALSRPGPYYGGQADAYVKVKNGEEDWVRVHPDFDKHVEWTYGQIVYQEQIMYILRDLAGFDMPKVLRVRKIIGKKLGEHQFAALWDDFRTGCNANGVGDDDALRVWNSITTAAGYAFNIAHAYSYSLISWWSMYFKKLTTTIFYASALNKNGDGKDDIPRRTLLLQDAEKNGHFGKILPPHPKLSEKSWIPQGNILRAGFGQIPGVGSNTAKTILEYRWQDKTIAMSLGKEQEFDWWHLINIKGLGEKTIMKMMEFSESKDPFGVNLVANQLGEFRRQLANGEFGNHLPGLDEFKFSDDMPDRDVCAFVGVIKNIVYTDEVERIREKTGKKVDEILADLKDPDKTKKATIFAQDEFGEVALRVSRWKYPELSRVVTSLNADKHMVVAWGMSYERGSGSLQCKQLWVLDLD